MIEFFGGAMAAVSFNIVSFVLVRGIIAAMGVK